MGSGPAAAENANRLERLLSVTANRVKTDDPVETALVGQCRRSKTMTTITNTVPSQQSQRPILLSDVEMDAVAGGLTPKGLGYLAGAFAAGWAIGTYLDSQFHWSDQLGDWLAS
jgi:hypothetical protein